MSLLLVSCWLLLQNSAHVAAIGCSNSSTSLQLKQWSGHDSCELGFFCSPACHLFYCLRFLFQLGAVVFDVTEL